MDKTAQAFHLSAIFSSFTLPFYQCLILQFHIYWLNKLNIDGFATLDTKKERQKRSYTQLMQNKEMNKRTLVSELMKQSINKDAKIFFKANIKY
ncbi:TPA: hypothetical protein ACPY0B_000720 [Citrobacter farmeri]